MKTDSFGQHIYNENDICELYLANPESLNLKRTLIDTKISFDNILDLNETPELILYQEPNLSVEEFDNLSQSNYHMPKEYLEMDIAKYVLEQCKNDDELQRAGQELLLFQERNMFILLKYLKYLVDIMRKNNIVYGVGRGSSVASFVLYLIGIHRINSLYYDLDIKEFLKDVT